MSTPEAGVPLTIIIPAWNRATTLRRTLDSVGAQTLRPLKVVLVDNGSRDATRQIMTEWADEVSAPDFIVTVVDEPRHGASYARNRGLDEVDTEYVMYFDSDDVMSPTHAYEMLQTAFDNPRAQIVGRSVAYHPLNGKERRLLFTTEQPMFNHLMHGILATSRYIARTKLIRDVGGWDNTSLSWDDWELGLRLLLAEPVLAEAEGDPTAGIYAQTDSITGTCFSHSPSRWETTIEINRQNLKRAQRDDLLPWLETRSMVLAAKYWREGAFSESRRLRRHTLDKAPRQRCSRLKLIYLQHRLMGRGSAVLARILFPGTART